jgi:hypothetical protein
MNAPSPTVRQYCTQNDLSERVCSGGIEYLVDNWQRIVTGIVDGYTGLFDEYLNDMDSRRIIYELVPLADEIERGIVAASLPALDGDFFKSTRSTNSCIWGEDVAAKSGYRPDRDWWYYRVPTNLSRVEDPDAWPRPGHSNPERKK